MPHPLAFCVAQNSGPILLTHRAISTGPTGSLLHGYIQSFSLMSRATAQIKGCLWGAFLGLGRIQGWARLFLGEGPSGFTSFPCTCRPGVLANLQAQVEHGGPGATAPQALPASLRGPDLRRKHPQRTQNRLLINITWPWFRTNKATQLHVKPSRYQKLRRGGVSYP